MGTPKSVAMIPPAQRLAGVNYSIRRVAVEGKKTEAAGKRIHWLNTGDPIAFGFCTPAHMVAAVEKSLRDGENGYGPSSGLLEAREAVAAENTSRGWPITANRIVLSSGSSEGIDFALTALADPGDEVLLPRPTYPLYTAVSHKIGARDVYYGTDPKNGWLPDPNEIRKLITPRTKALVVNDPNNPTGASYPDSLRRELLNIVDQYGLTMIADEIYQDVPYDGPVAPIGSLDNDAPIISLSGLSKGYLAPGWRTGWLAVGGGDRLKDVLTGITKLAEGRLCSTMPMQRAIVPALTGDRSHQQAFRAALRERAELVYKRANATPGMSCTMPKAAFYAMPRIALPPGKTDEQYIIELLHATGVLCVHGSGFGMDPGDGYFRMVFLAPPAQLNEIWDLIGEFNKTFLAR
ncbi:MAG TPA: aminotransferase class I/II-fold pyridoxal phosphate-dependent enzyme [Vicinamibacterales bacterium]|nr:aminotransferase class I/II-fold pyridoxal phosphate-dependent enzyme [Vicinamibacterales bacterium]